MRKFLCIIFAFIICNSLSSCDVKNKIKDVVVSYEDSKELDPSSGDTHTYRQLCKLTEERSLEVLECFDNHNKNGLMELFAPAISSKYPLSEQIDKVFEIYDSKSITYEELSTDESSTGKEDGTYYLRNYRGYFYDVELESGKTFEILVSVCFVDDDNPDMIGISNIFLKDDEGNNLRIIGQYNSNQAMLAE